MRMVKPGHSRGRFSCFLPGFLSGFLPRAAFPVREVPARVSCRGFLQVSCRVSCGFLTLVLNSYGKIKYQTQASSGAGSAEGM